MPCDSRLHELAAAGGWTASRLNCLIARTRNNTLRQHRLAARYLRLARLHSPIFDGPGTRSSPARPAPDQQLSRAPQRLFGTQSLASIRLSIGQAARKYRRGSLHKPLGSDAGAVSLIPPNDGGRIRVLGGRQLGDVCTGYVLYIMYVYDTLVLVEPGSITKRLIHVM